MNIERAAAAAGAAGLAIGPAPIQPVRDARPEQGAFANFHRNSPMTADIENGEELADYALEWAEKATTDGPPPTLRADS